MTVPYQLAKSDGVNFVDVYPLEADGGNAVPREILGMFRYEFDDYDDVRWRLPAVYGDRSNDFMVGTYFNIVNDGNGLDGVYIVNAPPSFTTQTEIPVLPVTATPPGGPYVNPFGTASILKVAGDIRYRFVDTFPFNVQGSAGTTQGYQDVLMTAVAWTGVPAAMRPYLPTGLTAGTFYNVRVDVDTNPTQVITVLGENAPNFNALIVQINTQLVGARAVLTSAGVRFVSNTQGALSTIVLDIPPVAPQLFAAPSPLAITYTAIFGASVVGVDGVDDGVYTCSYDSQLSIFDATRNQTVTYILLAQELPAAFAPLSSVQLPVPYGFITYNPNALDVTPQTPLQLPGRGMTAWGFSYDQDFLQMLENFTSTLANGPVGSIEGQLWYKADNIDPTNLTLTATDRLFVCTDDSIPGNPEWAEVLLITSGSSPFLFRAGDILDLPDFSGSGNSGRLQYATQLSTGDFDPAVDNSPLVLVTKGYVDSLVGGVTWLDPVLEPNLVADQSFPTWAVPDFDITVANTATDEFTIDGDYAELFRTGRTFTVTGSTGNDGSYTVLAPGATWDCGTNETVIPVLVVASAVADGRIQVRITSTAAYLITPEPYTINTQTAGGPGVGSWTITGNFASRFAVNDTFVVFGNTSGDDGTYSVFSATDVGPDTVIVVNETVTGATNDGTLYHVTGDWNGFVLGGAGEVSHGHVVAWNGTMWVEVLQTPLNVGRPIDVDDRFGLIMAPQGYPVQLFGTSPFIYHEVSGQSANNIPIATSAGSTITVTGDFSAVFTEGITFEIVCSTGDDGFYANAVDSVFALGITTITIEGTLPVGDSTGNLVIVNQGKIATATAVSVPDYTVTWTMYTPSGSDAVFVANEDSPSFGNSYTFSTVSPDDAWDKGEFTTVWAPGIYGTDYKWTLIATLNQILPGAGLSQSGNLFNVNPDTVTNTTFINGSNQVAVNLVTLDARYVNTSGDTMTGFLTLNADPVNPLHAATKQYVDNKVYNIPFDISYFVVGTQQFPSTMVGMFVANRGIHVDSTASNAGRCRVAPTLATTYDVYKNGTSLVMQVTFPALSTSATFPPYLDFDLVAGDYLEIRTPAILDVTIEDVGITIGGCAVATQCSMT